jgi:hypothetical protein
VLCFFLLARLVGLDKSASADSHTVWKRQEPLETEFVDSELLGTSNFSPLKIVCTRVVAAQRQAFSVLDTVIRYRRANHAPNLTTKRPAKDMASWVYRGTRYFGGRRLRRVDIAVASIACLVV